MLTKYSLVISKVHLKLKDLSAKLEEVERSKRHKIKKMRKEMEKQFINLKTKN